MQFAAYALAFLLLGRKHPPGKPAHPLLRPPARGHVLAVQSHPGYLPLHVKDRVVSHIPHAFAQREFIAHRLPAGEHLAEHAAVRRAFTFRHAFEQHPARQLFPAAVQGVCRSRIQRDYAPAHVQQHGRITQRVHECRQMVTLLHHLPLGFLSLGNVVNNGKDRPAPLVLYGTRIDLHVQQGTVHTPVLALKKGRPLLHKPAGPLGKILRGRKRNVM